MNANRLLTAFFDTQSDAQRAIDRLVQAGIPRSEINLVAGENRGSGAGMTGAGTSSLGASNTATSSSSSYGSPSSANYEDTGFWASLSKLFMPDEDRHTYAEGLRRGGYLVSVHATDAQYAKALDILDDDGTINIDERANSWRSEGWTGYDKTRSTSALGATAGATSRSSATTGTNMGTAAAARSTAATSRDGRTDEVIPIAEERLNIGKREEIAGRVRVRSYVVETPVHEQVNLREEHVSVERRPVDRTVTGAEAAFKDRTIEATEKAERAVVNKEARVTEEVVVHKNAENRQETINDTVRKTKVEVEDDRNRRGTGTTGTTSTSGTRKPV